ncbi:MAG TPA: carbon-nitrogen hydrolase family protein [Acidobacteriota bacterium]|jgi:predicted amidohydrolase|nr:carbon-nitrogen hydrolase family protein [Acidobacteriota bacterium]
MSRVFQFFLLTVIVVGAATVAAVNRKNIGGPKNETDNLLAWDNASPTGGWKAGAPRDEIAPATSAEPSKKGLRMSGRGIQWCAGYWRKAIGGIQGGAVYDFKAIVETDRIDNLVENLQVLLTWTGFQPDWRSSGRHMPAYATHFRKVDSRTVEISEQFRAPDVARGAEIDLWLKWNGSARVLWRDVTLVRGAVKPHRKVRVATVYWRNAGPTTIDNNLKHFMEKVDEAGKKHPDVILLSECFKKVGTGFSTAELADRIPGKVFNLITEKAKAYNSYIIYGDYLREGPYIFNEAIIVDRNGKVAGTYKKVQLPVDEAMTLSPGTQWPVFDLDFGRVGLLICHDTAFPEPPRIMGLKGAEIVFVPIWGGDVTTMQARAAENGYYWVTAGFDLPSMIISPDRKILSSTWKNQGTGVAFAEIDLDQPVRQDWIGVWQNAVWNQRRPELYSPLTKEQ